MLDVELRTQLVRYLSHAISLRAFCEWFTPAAWNIDQRADRATADSFHEVELLLSEHAHGDWEEDELRERLAPLVTTYTVRYGGGPSWSSTGEVKVVKAALVAEGHRSPVPS
jgi:hypothetical protein